MSLSLLLYQRLDARTPVPIPRAWRIRFGVEVDADAFGVFAGHTPVRQLECDGATGQMDHERARRSTCLT